jgi:hypothetical protein
MAMDIFDDEFAGMGGTYEIVKGKRRLVPGSRTMPPEAAVVIEEPVAAPMPTPAPAAED